MAKKITPEQLASNGTEDGHQLALMCWCADNVQIYPELKWLYAVPNGGSRHKAEAGKLVAMGVKTGVPDLCLPIKRGKFSGIYIELKRPDSVGKKKGIPSDEQLGWIDFLRSQDYGAIVCYGWENARDTLIKYLKWS